MKHFISLLFLGACTTHPGNKSSLNGIWRHEYLNKVIQYEFKDSLFKRTRMDVDLAIENSGKLFHTINPKRLTHTITLVPDISYADGDTFRPACESLDILSLNDSVMVVIRPTKSLFSKDTKSFSLMNDTLRLKRVK